MDGEALFKHKQAMWRLSRNQVKVNFKNLEGYFYIPDFHSWGDFFRDQWVWSLTPQ